MNISGVVLILALVLLVGFLAGTFAFLVYVIRFSKKYASYKAELQKEGKYDEWISQQKGLVGFEKISWYLNFIFLLAILIYGFGTRESVSPNIFITLSGLLVYLFYPYVLISLFILSRLYRKVPKDWQQD